MSHVSQTPSSPINPHPWVSTVSYLLGGAGGGLLCFPAESLKKRVQRGELGSRDLWRVTPAFQQALHPRALFRGSPAFALSVTVATVSCTTFERFLHQLPGYNPDSPLHNGLIAAGSGAVGAIFGSTPVENVILKQQALKSGPGAAIKNMFAQSISRPWVGLSPLMVREAGFALTMLFVAPLARQKVSETSASPVLAEAAGVVSAVVGALLTHPADTIATHMQKADGHCTIRNAIKQLYAENGVRAFYKGGAFRAGFLFPGCVFLIPRIKNLVEHALS